MNVRRIQSFECRIGRYDPLLLDLCLIRFIQNEQILHGTVAGTDVYLADFL